MSRDLLSCRLIYSTQSGRAKACARRVSRILREQTILSIVSPIQSFDRAIFDINIFSSSLRESKTLLILFVSTTGDGEHTDTIQRTWKKLLQKSLPTDLLAGVKVALFNLGDRAYGSQFCAAGRKLAVRLLQLGAQLWIDVGYGDDGTSGGGVFVDLDTWVTTQLLSKLELALLRRSAPIHVPPFTSDAYSIRVHRQFVCTGTAEELQKPEFAAGYDSFFCILCPLTAYAYDYQARRKIDSIPQLYSPLFGKVTQNDRLTSADWEQNTRHIRLHVNFDSSRGVVTAIDDVHPLPYRAGDVAVVIPSNSLVQVQKFIDVLPLRIVADADKPLDVDFVMESGFDTDGGFAAWPGKCTLRGWLTYCADIHALPEREDLRALSWYCSMTHELGTDQRDKLVALSETTAAALYNDYILREKRMWADVLYDFDALRHDDSLLTLQALFSLLSPIRPREFSIASSPSDAIQIESDAGSTRGFSVELSVAVVEGTTPLGRKYQGLCSNYLSSLGIGTTTVRLWIRPGSFAGLPLELSSKGLGCAFFQTPVIYIGAGTGIAPLRSLIRERNARLVSANVEANNERSTLSAQSAKDDILIFGCRKEYADFYYHLEWKALCERGQLDLFTAFSQEQRHKVYVQQVVRDERSLLAHHVLHNQGAIYIAGNPRMARAVKQEIVECLANALSGDEKKAMKMLTILQQMGRLSIEAWG